jgi:hypothetical protein
MTTKSMYRNVSAQRLSGRAVFAVFFPEPSLSQIAQRFDHYKGSRCRGGRDAVLRTSIQQNVARTLYKLLVII